MGDHADKQGAESVVGGALAESRDALESSRWHAAIVAAERAMRHARAAHDFPSLIDAAQIAGRAHERVRCAALEGASGVLIAGRDSDLPDPVPPGCYLLQPFYVGADATRFRAAAAAGGVPVIVLAREPMTRDGRWPVVAVGDVIVRTHVDPPAGVQRDESRVTRDRYEGPAPIEWLMSARDRLVSAALERVDPAEHAHWRVDDLLEIYSAIPDSEAVVGELIRAAREALGAPRPTTLRWRPVVDDPRSF